MVLSSIIAAVKAEGGIDATDDQVRQWALDRYRRLVADSQYIKRMLSLGLTVAGQESYSVPAEVVDIRWVKVGESAPYDLISMDEWQAVKGGEAGVSGGGVYTLGFDDDTDDERILLNPAPGEAGVPVVAFCAVLPAVINDDQAPAVPEDFHQVIVAGAIADGLKRMDEAHDDGSVWESDFLAGVERLRTRRMSRAGSGPRRIRVFRR